MRAVPLLGSILKCSLSSLRKNAALIDMTNQRCKSEPAVTGQVNFSVDDAMRLIATEARKLAESARANLGVLPSQCKQLEGQDSGQ